MLIQEVDDVVVSGGVGVLVKVKVLKGGVVLVGVVGLVAIVLILEMNIQEKIKLGIIEEVNFFGEVVYIGIMNSIN